MCALAGRPLMRVFVGAAAALRHTGLEETALSEPEHSSHPNPVASSTCTHIPQDSQDIKWVQGILHGEVESKLTEPHGELGWGGDPGL